MNLNKFNLTVHLVSSLDGFIAKKDNSVSWFETTDFYEQGIEVNNENKLSNQADCFVMGANTYRHAVELSKTYSWPYGDIPTIILSNTKLSKIHKNIRFYQGDFKTLVENKLKPNFQNVWVVGGSFTVNSLLKLKFIHEIRLTIIPIILGSGLRLFNYSDIEHLLHLKDVKAYKNGLVEFIYQIKK